MFQFSSSFPPRAVSTHTRRRSFDFGSGLGFDDWLNRDRMMRPRTCVVTRPLVIKTSTWAMVSVTQLALILGMPTASIGQQSVESDRSKYREQ